MHKKNWLSATVVAIFMMVLGCTAYISDYYRAEEKALDIIEKQNEEISITVSEDQIVFEPQSAEVGFIFYPGGKVAYEAYAPLMNACAEKGILGVLLEMPANLAVLDMNAADGIIEEFPEISKWYIGGHSLGGSMAAGYVEAHADEFDGLVLLASYSTKDLSDSDLKVLSIYGTEDKVMNAEKYAENRANLPQELEEDILEGGSHAYFGMYGEQEGDGTARISNEEQIRQTADLIEQFVQE